MTTERNRTRSAETTSPVVDLSRAREARRLKDLAGRCRIGDELNRKSLSCLFGSGLLYTRQGARLGRDLLLAHQHLLRVWEILAKLGDLPAADAAEEIEQLHREATALLSRTAELTARTDIVLARHR